MINFLNTTPNHPCTVLYSTLLYSPSHPLYSARCVPMFHWVAGIYCGPLRLLAWEVSNTLRHSWEEQPCEGQQGPPEEGAVGGGRAKASSSGGREKPLQQMQETEAAVSVPGHVPVPLLCDLLTGQEQDLQPGARHVACTVEMCPLDRVSV